MVFGKRPWPRSVPPSVPVVSLGCNRRDARFKERSARPRRRGAARRRTVTLARVRQIG